DENISRAEHGVKTAARNNAELCILPEAFSNRYVGQFENIEEVLRNVPSHRPIIEKFRGVAEEGQIAIVLPFIERISDRKTFNSEVLIGNDGKVLGHYRKLHIPDSEGYREDLYFNPGNEGYVVADIGSLRIGLGICWDEWFPEMARILALKGAQLLVYPSAIGSEIAVPDFDSRPSWELVMRANAVMNRVFIAATNRVGQEEVISFYGGSFVVDPWGNVMTRASLRKPTIVYAELDLSEIDRANSFFGFLSTRRPDTYGDLTKKDKSSRAKNADGRVDL
ncbi:MAG: N-carbamoylputrescine amidase, partial [Thermoplasmata archaeon]|nr:N-carbamoylputrescine amidase [Thermoplasmata archaeon]